MDALEQYIHDHTSPEEELLHELDRATNLRVVQPRMLSGHIQGRLLEMLVRMLRPQRILEIGTFTGYSALSMAAGLEEGGELHTIEVEDELEELAQSFFDRSPHGAKIRLHIGSALDIAPALGMEFDLVFIDFSVNDESQNNAINKLTYEGLIRKIWKHSSNPGIICIAMTQDNGTSVQECHGEVTEKYSVPFVSYHDAMLNFLNTNDVQWSDISGDNIHPNMSGHAILSAMLTTYLQYVTDNLDSIDDADPELTPAGDDGAKYENAVLLTTDEAQPVSTGAFEMKAMDFGGFKNPWIAKLPADAEITDDDAFVIEVEAQNIGLLYAKLTSNAGKADVYVDDELVATIDADFTGGWGNYVQFAQVKSFMDTGKHTLKIVPKAGTEGKPFAFYISGITIS